MEGKQVLDEAVKQIGLKIAAEKPYLFMVDKIIVDHLQREKNGIIQFSVRVYNGKVTDVVASKTIRYVLK